jgi:hypothetical protein
MASAATAATAATAAARCNMTRPLAAGLCSIISTVRQHAYARHHLALPAPVCEPAHRPPAHRQVISTATFQAGLPPRLTMLLLPCPPRLFPLRKRHAPLAWLTNDDGDPRVAVAVPHRPPHWRLPFAPPLLAACMCSQRSSPASVPVTLLFFFSDHATSPFRPLVHVPAHNRPLLYAR